MIAQVEESILMILSLIVHRGLQNYILEKTDARFKVTLYSIIEWFLKNV